MKQGTKGTSMENKKERSKKIRRLGRSKVGAGKITYCSRSFVYII
jgi:hypothetical protein